MKNENKPLDFIGIMILILILAICWTCFMWPEIEWEDWVIDEYYKQEGG